MQYSQKPQNESHIRTASGHNKFKPLKSIGVFCSYISIPAKLHYVEAKDQNVPVCLQKLDILCVGTLFRPL